MAHTHDIIDSDKRFMIDPKTRVITFLGEGKLALIQGDHNSERVTFAIPRYVEGHDMLLCTKVEVHYNNISTDKKNQSKDVYTVTDLQVSPDSDDIVSFSWLISGNATVYSGILSFAISFKCLTGTKIDYNWHTGIYSNVTVSKGMNNGEAIVAEYSDVLEAWKQEIIEELRQEQPGGGGTADVASAIKTTSGEELRFFVGTKAEYDALESKDGLFAIISDDTTKEELFARLEALEKGGTTSSELSIKQDMPPFFSGQCAFPAEKGIYVISFENRTLTLYVPEPVGPGSLQYSTECITDDAVTCRLKFYNGILYVQKKNDSGEYENYVDYNEDFKVMKLASVYQ